MSMFPPELPGMSMKSYSLRPGNGVQRTEMDAGYARARRRYTAVPTDVTVQWRFTLAELARFEEFYKNEIDGGASWFTVKIVDGRGEGTYEARFKEPYEATTEAREFLWLVNATLEVMF